MGSQIGTTNTITTSTTKDFPQQIVATTRDFPQQIVATTRDFPQQIVGCKYDRDILSCSDLHIFEDCNFIALDGPIGVFGMLVNISQQILGCNYDGDILSCSDLHIFEACNFIALGCPIGMFGMVANVINIIVFFRQGFTNTVNISFFGLAISDFCCLLTLLWVCFCLNPFIVKAGLYFIPQDLMYLPGAWPHIICGRITSYITVFITAERCLSIITPLRVKQIITPKRATVVICLIYIINLLTLAPEYASFYLAYTYIPERNASFLTMLYTSHRQALIGLVYILISFTGVTSFFGVVVWTIILVIKLQQSSQWRKQASGDRHGTISSRDKKTIKMVAIIASILIACYTPGTIIALTTFIVNDLTVGGKYTNLSIAVWSFAFVFQSVNSSANIFIYYRMSSNYRQAFDELFGKTAKDVDGKQAGRTFHSSGKTKNFGSV